MKRIALTLLSILTSGFAFCQNIFTGKAFNEEFNIYIEINFNACDITVPGQEVYGEMCGFIGDEKDFRKWFILEADVEGDKAMVVISNDEGSEDLTATIEHRLIEIKTTDGETQKIHQYTLKQQQGSSLKIARNRKWQKLPKTIVFNGR